MIVHNFNMYLDGGAAIAARRLHDSLAMHGIVSRYYHSPWLSVPSDDSYRGFEHNTKLTFFQKVTDRFSGKYFFRRDFQRNLDRFLMNKPDGFCTFSYARLPFETSVGFDIEKPDVIHLHWISGLFDYPSFFDSIPNELPIVWTLQDMNPFTGGCHHAMDCEKYRFECGNCPQLNANRSSEDLSHQNMTIKWDAIKNKTIHVVACCNWLETCARQSKLFSRAKSFRTIPNSVDTRSFSTIDKLSCRRALSIDDNAFVLCFGAFSIENRGKGLPELQKAMEQLRDIPTVVVTFGSGNPKWLQNTKNLEFKLLGTVNSAELLSLCYSAADTFVIPSHYESLAHTVLEAMSCSTPVVGFRIGGIPEMIRTGITGLLADAANTDDLARQIRWMFEHPEERVQMGKNARQMVEREFFLGAQVNKYVELYKAVVQSRDQTAVGPEANVLAPEP